MKGLVGSPLLVGGLGPGPLGPPLNAALGQYLIGQLRHQRKLTTVLSPPSERIKHRSKLTTSHCI